MVSPQEYPFPVQYATLTDGMRIAYAESGTGPRTLVFVHGFASYLPVWSKNMEVLHRYYRCLALDLPGHGLSDRGDFPYSLPFYAEVLKKWLLQIGGAGPFVLVGHSMGGQISMRLSLDAPELISHLVLVAPAGFETFSDTERMVLQNMTTGSILQSSQYYQWVLNLKNYFYQLNEKEYEKLREFSRDFYSLQENPNLPKLIYRTVKGMLDNPVYPELPRLELPCQIFFGKKDRLIPNPVLRRNVATEDIARRGAGQISGSQLKLYENCGHFLQYEFPSRFNIDLYKFLNPLTYA